MPREQEKLKSPGGRVRGGIDLTFLVLVLLLLVIGLVMMFSASYAYAYYYMNNSYHYIIRQAIWAVAGVAAMFGAAMVDYHVWHKLAWPLVLAALALLVAVYAMPAINDAHRWIFIGGQTFQPSELAKFALVLVFAHIISLNSDRMGSFQYGVMPFLVITGVFAVLIVFEPHLSATVLVVALAGVMMFVGGARLKWFGFAGLMAAGGVGVIMAVPKLNARAMQRIAVWRNPFIDPQKDGFQTIQSLYAIGSGGLWGSGIGNSRQKYLFLPEPQNDFVFSVVCEELGFIGAVLIILLFALLICRGFMIAVKARDRFGTMLCVGLVAQVGLQVLLNIAVVTNTIPATGISLPFFSYGGTSLLMLLGEMGIVLSISRQTTMEKE